MIVELTLICTFIFHHLLLGLLIGGSVWLLFRLPLNIGPQARSMLWFTSYLLITLIPFSAFIFGSPANAPIKTKTITIDQTQQTAVIEAAVKEKPLAQVATIEDKAQFWHVSQEIINALSPFLTILLLVWLAGIVWRTAMLGYRLYNSWQMGQKTTVKRQIDLGNDATLTVWLSEHTSSPMVLGLRQPKIIIPARLIDELNEQQLRHVILHEQAHIDRKDLIMSALQEVIAISFWWSPVIRPLNHQIHLSRELACDFRAANKAKEPLKYAQTLLDCAKLMFAHKQNVLAMSLFSQKKDLTVRINEVINIQTGNRFNRLPALAGCLLLAVSSYAVAQTFTPRVDIGQIKVGAKLFARQTAFDSEILIKAVAANRLGVIEQMVNDGIDIDVAVIGDGTALILAVQYNKPDMVEGLLRLGANVNQPSPGDGNPLIKAVQLGNLAIIKTLLDGGADINADVWGDETPLINASMRGNLSLVSYLVERGADVNLASASSDDNITPLKAAATADVRDYLIGQGAVL